MRTYRKFLIIFAVVLFCVFVSAASATDTTITNVNVYANTNAWQDTPNEGTPPAISISGRYVYADALDISEYQAAIGQPIILTVHQQGAAVLQAETSGTKSGYGITYDTGGSVTDNPFEVTYTNAGFKQIVLNNLANPGGTYTSSLSKSVQIIADVSFTATATPSILPTGYAGTVSLSLSPTPKPPYGTSYTYTWKNGNTVLVEDSSSYTYSWNPPQGAAGGYLFTCIVKCGGEIVTTTSPATVTVNPVSGIELNNVNVYATSNQYDVAPDNLFETGNVQTSGIVHISGRYVYAAGLTPDNASIKIGETVSILTVGQQGAAVVINETAGTDLGYMMGETTAITYPIRTSYDSSGIKTFTITAIRNPAGSYSTAISARIDVLSGTAGDYITDTEVKNTNIYAGSNKYQICPVDEVLPEISVSNRYLYATGLSANPQSTSTTETITLSAINQQGAVVVNSATTGTDYGYTISYGEGGTQIDNNPLHVAYSTEGTKSITASMSNSGGGAISGLTTTVSILGAPTTIQATASNTAIKSAETITLSLESAPIIPSGDTYTYTWMQGSNTLVANAVSYAYSWKAPQADPGTAYQFVCIVTSTLTGLSTESLPVTVVISPLGYVNLHNVNIYAGSNQYDVAPDSYVQSMVSIEGITHISGRYLYLSELSAKPNQVYPTQEVTFTQENQQGAAVIENSTAGTDTGYSFTYETGITGNSFTHIYDSNGVKSVSLSVRNQATSAITATTTVTVNSPQIVSDVKLTSFDITPVSQEITATISAQSRETKYDLSYQWYYSTDNARTWKLIDGQTEKDLSFMPQEAGTYVLKARVSDPYGWTDSYDAGYTAVSAKVLQDYEPQTVDSKISSIQARSTDSYQAQREYDFGNTIVQNVLWTSNKAIIAAGNAVYSIDSNTHEITPISQRTGNTISKVYLGLTNAIINDVDNIIGVYNYADGGFRYVTEAGSNIIAVTGNYAAVIKNGMLNIYNKSNKLQASIASTATELVASDATDVFAYFESNKLHYYTISGSTVSEHVSEITPSDYVITSVKQVSGTDSWLITSRYQTPGQGTPYTYIVDISSAGTLTEVLNTTDPLALNNAQATKANAIIGTDRTNVYVISPDGAIQGTYMAGGLLNDASIAIGNGLYAVTGGRDNLAYFITRTDTTWSLEQMTDFAETIYKTQLNNDGTYALIVTANKAYLLQYDETILSNYFINGVVVDSNGKPYANKYITIDSSTIKTDDSGFFVYAVKPGHTYTIITGSKTTQYTATNQALQTLSIKIQSQLVSQDVTYGATYNSNTGNIEMHYNDAVDRTSVIVWKVRDTTNGQTVYQKTVSSGEDAYYFVPQDKQSNNYFVSVEANRGDTTVKNTWSITPSGQGQIVNLFGMDDTGKNILFGFFLILLAGLFGYLHQHIGTIIIAFAAAVLRYLGLITVPWIMIIIAVVVSIIAAIAHRGEGK